jgi:large subunit ribosomal protein L19
MESFMNTIEKIENKYLKTDVVDFKPGDRVKVSIRIIEESKERIQVFEGIVIKKQGFGVNASFTVRKISFNVGVERTFLVNSPVVQTITKVNSGIVRRAKLYYLRDKIGKKSKIKIKD